MKKESDEFAAKVKEFDVRESHYVSRNRRDELLKRFGKYEERLETTQGTRDLRSPVKWMCYGLLAIFALFSVVQFFQLSGLLTSKEPVSSSTWAWMGARQVLAMLGLGAVAWFFIRWQDRWFTQHAETEFRLKKQAFDVERAGWVYEMALAWRKEASSEMPSDLLSGLSHNLFSEETPSGAVATPAEHVASAILGASASATMKTPAGEISFDRKGIGRLAKEME